MPYDLTNLIRYEDTIRLHFDTKGKTAWLTMKNYGCVFGMVPEDAVWVVTVGVAATESGALPESPEDQKALVALGIKPGEFRPYPDSICIGEMLDAIEVIKLQVAILEITSLLREKVLTRHAANAVVTNALGFLPNRNFVSPFLPDYDDFFTITKRNLNLFLNSPPGAPAIAKQIKDYGEKTNNPQKEGPEEEVGFSAYFPKANLILQEERTSLDGSGKGKTENHDPRYIEPIPSGLPDPTQIINSSSDPQINLVRQEGKKPIYRPPEWEFQWIVDELDRGIQEKVRSDDDSKGYRHGQIKRISCFALRGDSRDPVEHRAANGFLPGVTRNDPGVDASQSIKFAIDRSLTPQKVWVDEPDIKRTIHPLYLEVIKRFNLFHLGVFTKFPDFKGFISATKSTAIAKYFANQYSDDIECQTYCYAVRCRGGFHLDSHVPDNTPVTPKAYLHNLHSFNSYAEQEVAVAGAIWWEHIFGMRVLKCNVRGQFFSGPIFMKNDLIWEDNFAFSALFELLSGKSQGEDKGGAIHKSYEVAPFQYAEAGMANSGANSVSLASTTTVALVRVTPTQLTFGRQPAGTRGAAQTVKLTNLGAESVFVSFAMIVNDKGGDFKASISQDLNDPAVEVRKGQEFALQVHFEPKNAGDPTGAPCAGTLVIMTKTSSHDRTPGTRHMISLAGTAVQKPASLEVTPKLLDFGSIAKGTFSPKRIVALTNHSEEVIKIREIKHYGLFSADIAEAELRPHESRAINVTFNAPPGLGTWDGSLEVWCDGKDEPWIVKLTGTSAEPSYSLDLTPLHLNFEAWVLGTRSDFQHVTLKNNGNAVVTIKSVKVTPPGDFEWEQVGEGDENLRAGESRRIRVHFTPKAAGKQKPKLKITYGTGHASQVVALEGFGVSQIISSGPVRFDNLKVGTSKDAEVKLANTGDFPLSIVGLKIKCQKTDEFSTANLNEILAASSKLTIHVKFSPKADGERKGTLIVSYTVEGSNKVVTETEELTGRGVLEL